MPVPESNCNIVTSALILPDFDDTVLTRTTGHDGQQPNGKQQHFEMGICF